MTHIRFKDLSATDFGPCEICGQRAARHYAIHSLNKGDDADFVCRQCVSPTAVEFSRDSDVFEVRQTFEVHP